MTLKVADRVAWNVEDDEIVLMNLSTEKVIVSTGIGAKILEDIISGKDIDRIIETLSEQYKIDVAVVKYDVSNFVDELLKREYLVVSGD